MKKFKTHIDEMTTVDHSNGLKKIKDNQYKAMTHAVMKHMHNLVKTDPKTSVNGHAFNINREYNTGHSTRELAKKYQEHVKGLKEDAPGNNTASVPGGGDDNSLHMKKMRMYKTIHKRHGVPGMKKESKEFSASKYYLQPNGSWKKGGDGRSEGKTKTELNIMGKNLD